MSPGYGDSKGPDQSVQHESKDLDDNLHMHRMTCLKAFVLLDMAQTGLPIVHVGPVHPISQRHVYDPGVFIQVPPLAHCNSSHSFTSLAQFGPVQPGAQVQVYEPSVLTQVAPF